MQRRKQRPTFLRYLGIPALILLWWAAAAVIKATTPNAEMILPSPVEILAVDLPEFAAFYGKSGGITEPSYWLAFLVLAKNAAYTLWRVFAGMGAGILLGVAFALIMGWSRIVRLLFNWPIGMLRAVPTMALIPLFLLWFGGREYGTVLFVVFSIFVVIVVNAMVAIRNIPPHYAQFAATLGANRSQIYRTVVIPAMIPGIVGGIRVSLGAVWAVVLGAEYLAVDVGLGNLLLLAKTFSRTGRMLVIVILFGLFSIALNHFAVKILNRVTKWQA